MPSFEVLDQDGNSAKSHTGFRAKYELPLRRTFIFDENGILERIIGKVDTKNAAAQILEG